MATTPCNISCAECRQCSDVITEFTARDLAFTACGFYVAGIISVLFIVLVIKLKKNKKMCFREAEEPFRGKWEGASQKATMQVLKKHTLENSLSLDKNKSMESSAEVNDVLNDAANRSIESAENVLVSITDEREAIPDVGVSDKLEDNIPDTRLSNTNPLEQSTIETCVIDKDIKHEVESKKNTDNTLNPQNASSVNETPNRDDTGDVAVVKEREHTGDNAETSRDKSDIELSEESKETKTDSPVITVESDISTEMKPDIIQLEASETVASHGEPEEKTFQRKESVDHNNRVIVKNSSGADLFEKGRDSVMFDPDELILQNDNFRISQLSYN